MRLFIPPSIAVICLACRPAPAAQLCPTPQGVLTSPTTITQIVLTRTEGAPVAVPAYTILLTASGDAFYTGAPTVPVPGQFSGRLRLDDFPRLTEQLVAAGLAPATPAAPVPPEACGSEGRLSLSLQTADGHYLNTTFCPGSGEEQRYAGPIYATTATVRWQPGLHQLQLGPPN